MSVFRVMLQPFGDMVRRVVAESVVAGFHDAFRVVAADAPSEPKVEALPQDVVLLLDGPKKGGRK